jgi:hypothetical protein
MKGSSFGVIYDAFDGGIFDEDVPPSVTAVATSVTQLYQLIIGCNSTCIFMDDKKRKSGLLFNDKNVIVESTCVVNHTNYGLEQYNRHFNSLFNKRPSLLEFVQIVEKESCFQDQKLNNIRYGRRKEVEREVRTILV